MPSPFISTRAYHDARHAWIAALPPMRHADGGRPYSEQDFEPEAPLLTMADMDSSLWKPNVFLTFGHCFYHYRQVKGGGPMVGYARILTPHVGALFLLLDDIQGLCTGKGVTRAMDMTSTGGAFANLDLAFYCHFVGGSTSAKNNDPEDTSDVHTAVELFEALQHTNRLVAKSTATYARPPGLVQMLQGIMKQYDANTLWERLAPLRLAGEHATDPSMSFRLHLPRPSLDQLPPWWPPASRRSDPIKSAFEGRFELYHVEKLSNGVRAVVRPLSTAEGPPTMFHGGGGASCAIEVLRNLLPGLQVQYMQVKYKRPIMLDSNVVVEWTLQNGKWTAQILDWDKKVMQEIVLVATLVKL